MKKNILLFIFIVTTCFLFGQKSKHNLYFDSLATQWDEAMPLGNGILGALIWEKNKVLRFSLDRADLWDSRPMNGLHRDEFSYAWIYNQVMKGEYKPVQQNFDYPYDHEPAPTKIPGAALEFNTTNWGKSISNELDIKNAVCKVRWQNGTQLTTIVDANEPVGWFKFEHLKTPLQIFLIAPNYQGKIKNIADPVGGDDLARLGYKQGTIKKESHKITYQQKGWGNFEYEVVVAWKEIADGTVEGVWTITRTPVLNQAIKNTNTQLLLSKGFDPFYSKHVFWWNQFWRKSSISIPDPLIEKQWYLEQYKFGATARKNAPPISLQGIWTADNGRIPPWKGDFHHDLNTQLSYWPSYSGNHLDASIAYIDHFESNKANYKRYTRQFFNKEGIAVPGVTTLDGTEMGGWIQYSLSPTVSAWISQHYYLQWRYSMDKVFLKNKAYPWIKETAHFLENITVLDSLGHRVLLMSASPEINDNDLTAWFKKTTNYDLSLMKFNFKVAFELANELHLYKEANHWKAILNQFQDFSISDNQELLIAPDYSYSVSHRHFSNLMAIHPLGLLQWDSNKEEQQIIKNSIQRLDSMGPSNWCGYSYAWLANLKARAKDGLGASKALTIFATAFCSINSFHLNGDQTKSGYSSFTYRPFTLEGNFAFAAGLQEMLIQSYQNIIEVMPAIPAAWRDVSFNQLRTEGAFLVSANQSEGKLKQLIIVSEKGGTLTLKNPFIKYTYQKSKEVNIISSDAKFIKISFTPNSEIKFYAQ
jgi:alpha-L-fucosidase 2